VTLHRLKKVQGKKKRDAEVAEEKRKAEEKANDSSVSAGDGPPAYVDEEFEDTDLLRTKDQDVIF
jgi:V-type H+-transporting ATPase subunit D